MPSHLPKQSSNFNSKMLTMPIAAFCMASLLFVYTRTSIQAAKRNAQAHRDADGGQISWRNESLRRHGVIEPPEEQNSVKQLLGVGEKTAEVREERGVEEQRVRELARSRGRRGEE